MNSALLISTSSLTLQAGVGVLLYGLARTPGWRSVRLAGLIALTASFYSIGNVLTLLDPSAGVVREIGSRLKYFAAGAHVFAWMMYTHRSRDGRWHEGSEKARWLGLTALAVGVLCLVTGAHADTTRMWWVEVGWAGARYHLAASTPLGVVASYVDVVGLLVAFRPLILRRLRGDAPATAHLVGIVLFLACALDEVLVANGTIHFLMLAELGFCAVVLPLAVETVRRYAASAAELSWRSSALAGEVAVRTRERDQAQGALLESERHASLGRLAAGVAHQINNPLAYMQLNLELLREWGASHEGDGELRESIDAALDGATRIRRVVDALRAYTRTGDGALRPIAIAEFVQSALRLCDHHLRPIEVILDIGESSPVLGDEPTLVQLVVNLIQNAIDAIKDSPPPGGGRIVLRSTTLESGEASLEVIDNGPGIAPEDLPLVTEPYFTTRRSGDRMGLGLFLARATVERHGGRLEFASASPSGTIARVVLAPAPSILGEIAAPPPGARAPHMGLKSIATVVTR